MPSAGWSISGTWADCRLTTGPARGPVSSTAATLLTRVTAIRKASPSGRRRRCAVAPVTPPAVDDESVNELISAPAGAIERVLSRLDTFDGGAVGFLRAHGVTADEVRLWQERFLA